MAQKINPKSIRLGINQNWTSRWFNKRYTVRYLQEDMQIRDFLSKKLKAAKIEAIEIERTNKSVTVNLKSARPGLIIGRGGSGVDDLRKALVSYLMKSKKQIINADKNLINLNINIEEIRRPEISAPVVALNIAEDIEKRMPYRRTLKNHLAKIMQHKEAMGAKVMVSGRLDGAEIARAEWLKEGRLPLVTLRSDIDYGTATAFCMYGSVGIKVWIYKGEKF